MCSNNLKAIDNLVNNNRYFNCREHKLLFGKKTYVMGILNVTPDSFSDGGRYQTVDVAVAKAIQMVEDGADIIDVGGESTRPGHSEIEGAEEIERVVPVISKLKSILNVPISIDTSKSEVAREAILAGADIVNDVWGLQKDKKIADVAAEYGAGIIAMHNQIGTKYNNIIEDIENFLKISIKTAIAAGISKQSIMIDPGIGFGKTFEQNLFVMRNLSRFEELNFPILLGTSRKSMIGNVLNLPVNDRIEGTAATIAIGVMAGVDVVRVHDVKEMKRVALMSDSILR
jgi:dihydropteroate synthase